MINETQNNSIGVVTEQSSGAAIENDTIRISQYGEHDLNQTPKILAKNTTI